MKVRTFRKGHRKNSSYILSGWAHLVTIVAGSLLAALVSLFFIDKLLILELLAIPISLVLANLVEYSVHRWPMHKAVKVFGKRIFKSMYRTHSGKHHRYFTDEYMNMECDDDMHEVFASPSTVFSFIGFVIIPIAALASLFISTNVALLFFASCLSYYGIYEFIHFSTHLPNTHPILKIPFIMKAKQHHKIHHNTKLMRKWNFNIGLPLMDFVFGTLYKEREN